MAPCSTNFSFQHLRFAEKDIKIRKPIVEKMRRDRINGCIEQLKLILEKEFHKQDPNTKLEKADILEMTVSFLRQQLQPDPSQRDYGEGYSQCWREDTTSIITSAGPLQGLQQQLSTQVQRSIQQHPVVHSTSPDTGAKGPVWRPW
ncbi:unnamed protein product [Oncorhynchus mykiss]|uniref:Transcription factor HES-5 n=1 Tax=Oncorhynchus mykiss TaxID=8022 RepID=A0A060WTG5_ONCMY|nr:unnamed protein product [Oncorhynchus mykiss]